IASGSNESDEQRVAILNEVEDDQEKSATAANTSKSPPGPDDISQLPDDGPRCPELKSYPSQIFGTQARFFNRSWYEQYSWLEYSIALDATFCFACRHFAHVRQSGHTETAFTHDDFRNWKKASVSLKTHDTAAPHKYYMESWAEFKLQKEKGSKIKNLMNSAHAKAVEENRKYMRAVVESLRFTACQTIAQRAHREDEQSTNRDNFLELLHLLGKFDSVIKKKLSDGPSNAKYVHHDIQNEIVDIMANMIRKQISEEVKAAEHFA
uniref:TTF-type domain-containing protein n=1 Tax=Latimeria chalumnae TaxID=7897 RepID=H3ARI2_LATCH